MREIPQADEAGKIGYLGISPEFSGLNCRSSLLVFLLPTVVCMLLKLSVHVELIKYVYVKFILCLCEETGHLQWKVRQRRAALNDPLESLSGIAWGARIALLPLFERIVNICIKGQCNSSI
jgi:hypothetical protein